MTIETGTKLGRYEIREQLGVGGMGEVYRARDTQLGRDVAVKVLPSSFSDNEDRLRRFEQEACAASALNHPNIVVVYDVGNQPDEQWRVSTNGGGAPRWRAKAAEIVYRSSDLRLMLAKMRSGEKFDVGPPEPLFKASPLAFDYDVAPDGRFLFVTAAPGTQLLPFTVISDWTADLKK